MSDEVEFFRGGEVTQQYYKRSSIDKVWEVFGGVQVDIVLPCCLNE